MNAMELADYLPHRYPFLLVDRVTELTPGKRIRGCKMVSINEPFFQGHFPDSPIMPGVLIVEAMAQVSGVLAAATAPEGAAQTIHYLAGIDGARFKRPVVPGDRLDLQSELLAQKRDLMKFACRAAVAGELASEAQLLCVARPR